MSLATDAVLYYADNPVDFVEDVIRAKPDANQRDILNSVAKYPMTSVRSGHGIGKSAVQSWLAIWFLSTRPYPKIPCTAPTQHQLWDILWSEIAKWLRNNPALANELIWTKEKVYMKGSPEEWFAVGRTASKPDALQGFHAEHVLYIIDEASGVKDEIFEPVLGALSTKGSRLIMCGNPTRVSGFFYDSFHKHRDQYHTIHVDGRDSSRVDQEFIDKIVDMFGEDSDVFRVRVAGEFPRNEQNVFIPISLVTQAINADREEHVRPARISIGVDVARFGEDDTAIAENIDGDIQPLIVRHGQDLYTTADDIVSRYRSLRQRYPKYRGMIYVVVDDTGVGGGVTDILNREKAVQGLNRMIVVPVNFSSAVPDKEAAKRYADITTWMWACLRDMASSGELRLPNDDVLTGQLSSRKYYFAGTPEKLKLESKESLKKRGISSPDRADAVALSLYEGNVFDISNLIR